VGATIVIYQGPTTMVNEDTANIQGAVDKKSLRIAWTIGSKSATWEMVRIEKQAV